MSCQFKFSENTQNKKLIICSGAFGKRRAQDYNEDPAILKAITGLLNKQKILKIFFV